ncbi:hypothetical protein [Saccharothrix obliqua]|uniref:hypothetical protein n=1 Tax=Saccharothrix obliqua TaxID=2861747 RepID=UPI001C5E1BF3|nr:hypothetical protein [Saccharothrix obliqua]MBW4717421.1 hypothetical protein [Saccharothrix obliqua]
MHDTARRAYQEAERARRHRRMVREVIAEASTARAAASATYRIVYGRTAVLDRPPMLAPVRMARAVGWAAGAWVAATGYAAWQQHWQAQLLLALGSADVHRGYVVADRVRLSPAHSGPFVIRVSVPAPKPLPLRRPAWLRRTTSDNPAAPESFIPTSTGGTTVSRFNISDLAMEQAARAARYAPESMAYFGGDLQQWPEAIGHLALALSTFVKRGSAEYPVHPVVMEKLAEVYRALGVAASAANEVPGLFSRAHSIDLARHQAPRPGEHLWNVAR